MSTNPEPNIDSMSIEELRAELRASRVLSERQLETMERMQGLLDRTLTASERLAENNAKIIEKLINPTRRRGPSVH